MRIYTFNANEEEIKILEKNNINWSKFCHENIEKLMKKNKINITQQINIFLLSTMVIVLITIISLLNINTVLFLIGMIISPILLAINTIIFFLGVKHAR